MPREAFSDVSPATRKAMQGNKNKGTRPEMAVRRLVHGMGYRYRLHRKDLPGRPDLVFGPRRKVIFVHGCFWHRHVGCRKAAMPVSRTHYWAPKFARNIERDRCQMATLKDRGWGVLVIWECEVFADPQLPDRIVRFLGA